MRRRIAALVLSAGCGLPFVAHADWSALLNRLQQQATHSGQTTKLPSEAEVVAGLTGC